MSSSNAEYMYSNDILFYREINPPPPLQIELLPAIADTENEVEIPYHDISLSRSGIRQIMPSLVSDSILGTLRIRVRENF